MLIGVARERERERRENERQRGHDICMSRSAGRTPRSHVHVRYEQYGWRNDLDRIGWREKKRLCKVASSLTAESPARFVEGGRKFWVLLQTVLLFLPRSSPLFLPWSKSAIISRRKYFLMRGLPPDRRTDGQATPRQTGRPSQPRARGSTTHARKEDRSVAATDKSRPK